MLNIINFTHGAQYMMGAFAAFLLLQYIGLGLLVGAGRRADPRRRHSASSIERLFLQWLYKLDHLYGLLLTFGLALIIEGLFRNQFGSSGLPYHDAGAAAGRPAISASCSCRTTAPG